MNLGKIDLLVHFLCLRTKLLQTPEIPELLLLIAMLSLSSFLFFLLSPSPKFEGVLLGHCFRTGCVLACFHPIIEYHLFELGPTERFSSLLIVVYLSICTEASGTSILGLTRRGQLKRSSTISAAVGRRLEE